MADHHDPLETRAPAERQAAQFARLREILAVALPVAPALAEQLADHDIATLDGPAALARLPVMRKNRLMELQAAVPPLGGLATREAGAFDLLFQSPGPIYEPGMAAPDWWRFARALSAAGVGAGDVVLNCFAYHLTPAGHMLESAARALRATVIAGGVGNTEAQAQAAAHLRAGVYVGTPDFLAALLEKADGLGLSLAIDRAVVSGGPLFPAVREAYATRGILCLQCYGTADVGLIAYETAAAGGGPTPGMVVDEGVILEIVRPGTGDPVPQGEVGEVLVTALNADYPLVRFSTGDMSAMLSGTSPCGRTGPRIKGWMGRADQTAKVRGMFVRPEQVAEVLARHVEAVKARLTISREGDSDRMRLEIEAAGAPEGLAEAAAATVRDVVKLRAEVAVVAPGSLANDGKVIDDTRDFSDG